jgi:hypothetical protein
MLTWRNVTAVIALLAASIKRKRCAAHSRNRTRTIDWSTGEATPPRKEA